jgi:hypothetical protein
MKRAPLVRHGRCTKCGCYYSGIRRVGEDCGDISWSRDLTGPACDGIVLEVDPARDGSGWVQ